MSWGEALSSINWWAVIAATIAVILLGFVWYSEQLFAKQWRKLIDLKAAEAKKDKDMPVTMTSMALFYFLTNIVLACLLYLTLMEGIWEGMLMGAIIGFCIFGIMASNNAFAKRKFELSLIDGSYIILALTLSGLMLNWLSS